MNRSCRFCVRATCLAGLLLVTLSALTGAQASWIYAKALVAQQLLNYTWKNSVVTQTPAKPWSWADVSTVAQLKIPSLDATFVVLSDASGEAMAFGPGLVAGNPESAATQTLAIGGHRDTHLAFLEHLPVGDVISLDNAAGQTFHYTLVDKQVVDSRTHTLQVADQHPGLVLITCYPFDARQTGGPLRLVARAIPQAILQP